MKKESTNVLFYLSLANSQSGHFVVLLLKLKTTYGPKTSSYGSKTTTKLGGAGLLPNIVYYTYKTLSSSRSSRSKVTHIVSDNYTGNLSSQ